MPGDAVVAFQYRDNWFYIGDKDLDSYRIFSFYFLSGERTGLLSARINFNLSM